MMSSRREKIEALLADDPNDSFLRYSLAMELDKEGQLDASAASCGVSAARICCCHAAIRLSPALALHLALPVWLCQSNL